ncbi:hypothetical protein L0F63_002068, partial [Massospora cicadina]
ASTKQRVFRFKHGYGREAIQPIVPSDQFTHLAFEDNFETLDFEKWRHEITAGGGGNWEFQFYNNDRRSSFVKNGTLYIKPVLTMDYLRMDAKAFVKEGGLNLWGNTPGFQCTANGFYGCERTTQGDNIVNPIMSAQLRTINSFSFKYGRVEVGDWIWPAIWMMPTHHAYGGWPNSGEIDIVEARGNADDCNGDGVNTVASTLHWGNHWSKSMYNLTTAKATLPYDRDYANQFTKFTLEWTQTYLRTWADDELILNVEINEPFFKRANYTCDEFNPWESSPNLDAPFDQKYNLILNVAVGGVNGYFPDNPEPCTTKKPWHNQSPKAALEFFNHRNDWLPTWVDKEDSNSNAMAIKSVKVYTNQPSYK